MFKCLKTLCVGRIASRKVVAESDFYLEKSFNILAAALSSERPRVVISDYQATSRENFIPANIPLTSP